MTSVQPGSLYQVEALRVRVEPPHSMKSHPWLGALIGAVAGDAIAIGLKNISSGKCDRTEVYGNCDIEYAVVFAVGTVPGALLGALFGAGSKRENAEKRGSSLRG